MWKANIQYRANRKRFRLCLEPGVLRIDLVIQWHAGLDSDEDIDVLRESSSGHPQNKTGHRHFPAKKERKPHSIGPDAEARNFVSSLHKLRRIFMVTSSFAS
jgi:hypothetical protein